MRAFIVGNGPSLNKTPIWMLKDEVSYAVNAIHLLYNRTDWRPTHLVIGDLTQENRDWVHQERSTRWANIDERIDRFLECIEANGESNIHIRGNYRDWAYRLLGNRENVDYFDVCTHHSMGLDDRLEDRAPRAWHFPQICRWGGGIQMAIQLAALAGYSPLYVIGCDLGYEPGTDNHFHPDYDKVMVPAKADALNRIIGHAHELASTQWEIYNAGYGGELEAYPRKLFGELFL